MKIRILSDLHYEFWEKYWNYNKLDPVYLKPLDEDVLVLAGDIHSGSTNVVNVIKKFLSLGWKQIVYIPGNHEYYGTSYTDFNVKIREKTKYLPNVHILLDNFVVLDGVAFIGSTLWTNFGSNPLCEMQAKTYIADFKLVKGWNTDMCREAHYSSCTFLKTAYQALKQDVDHSVFVTHFLPSHSCVNERWKNGNDTLLNSYFANDLDDFIFSLEDSSWICGHTHDPVDVVLGSTRIIANPLGYPNERRPFNYDQVKQLII